MSIELTHALGALQLIKESADSAMRAIEAAKADQPVMSLGGSVRSAEVTGKVGVAVPQNEQPDELGSKFNNHADDRLTKSGGISFDVWSYILRLENECHGNPTGGENPTDWRDYYENDYTPHSAIEENFNYA